MTRELASVIGAASAAALCLCAPAALADWQCLSAGATIPAAARAASEYLGRAERVYPEHVLGVLRAGERVFLVNARDDGWSERVRIGLMELRQVEPDITAARRFQSALSGGPVPEAGGIPAGEFVCLARERAGRQGLAFHGEAVLLAAGRSVHLIDPVDLGVVVEVKAIGDQALDLREIFAASARAGIYAGLFKGRAQPGAVVAVRPPEDAVTFPVGPLGRPDGEVVITARAAEIGKAEQKAAAAIVTAPAPPASVEPPARVATAPTPSAPPVKPLPPEMAVAVVEKPEPIAAPAPAVAVMAAAPPVVAEPPLRASLVEAQVTPSPAKPTSRETPAPVAVDIAQPVMIVASIGATPAQGARPAAEQSYEEYAKAMKSLMALRRSGGVRSISEMTFVHPAIEDLRGRR